MFGGVEGLGGEGGEVVVAAAGLVAVDFLEGEDVGVEGADGGGEPVGVDEPVGQGAAVQQVEGRQAHLCTLRPWHSYRMIKLLCCSVLVFVALGAVGVWVRRRRGR